MESPYGIYFSLWKITYIPVLSTGIERDIFLHYFIMILCIFAILFCFIRQMINLFLFFTSLHWSADLRGPPQCTMYFFFFGLDELLRKEELAVKNKGQRMIRDNNIESSYS